MNKIFSPLFFINLGTKFARLNRYTGIGDPLDLPLGSMFRNCIFLAVLFEEGFSEGTLRSELIIAPFVERFKAAAILSKSYW